MQAVNSAGSSGPSSEGNLVYPGTAPAGGGGGGTAASTQTGLTAALSWAAGALTITYTGQDSFVQCSWPGGSYSAGDGSTLTTPAPHVLTPAPPVGSSITYFGRNTSPQVLVVQDSVGSADGVTTTVGGDGYVPTGMALPKHDPGNLKIGFGHFSFTIPSGWWTQVITYAAQLAMEAEGMTGPQIAASMQLQTTQLVTDADKNQAATQADSDHNTGVIQATLTSFQTSVNNVVTSTEKTLTTDITNMNTSLFQPDPASLQQWQNAQGQFLNWGTYHFIASFQQLLTQPPNDPTAGLVLPVMSVHTETGLVLDASGKVSLGQAGLWYDTGQRVPFSFDALTNSRDWPFFRRMEGAAVWLLWGVGLIWYLMPKQTV